MNTRRLWISITLLLIGLFAVGAAYLLIQLAPKKVVITYNSLPGAQVKLYKLESAEDLASVGAEKVTGREMDAVIESGKEVIVERGVYAISVSGKNIENRQYPLEVNNDTQKDITINYSQEYLTNLLKESEPTILATLNSELPTLQSIYSVRSSKLYLNGEWYGAQLRYIGTDQYDRDSLRVVLKKNSDGKWELVTKVPEIIVTRPKYPMIPDSVVTGVNSEEPVKIVPVGE